MPLYDALGWLEKNIAKAQGKGYGSNSIGSEIGCIQKLLNGKMPSLCVDFGGNIGDYSAELHKRFPDSNIICFEPSATNIEKLNKRFADHDKVRIEPVGVAAEPGTVTLYADVPGSGLGSMTKRDLSHFGRDFEIEETINIIRFEPYWQQQLGSEPIDIMKMDIEGHELDALAGCGSAIHATHIVQFEFGGTNIDTRTYFRDFWHFFQEQQFDLFRITPMGLQKLKKYRERDEYFRTTNFLACKR